MTYFNFNNNYVCETNIKKKQFNAIIKNKTTQFPISYRVTKSGDCTWQQLFTKLPSN